MYHTSPNITLFNMLCVIYLSYLCKSIAHGKSVSHIRVQPLRRVRLWLRRVACWNTASASDLYHQDSTIKTGDSASNNVNNSIVKHSSNLSLSLIVVNACLIHFRHINSIMVYFLSLIFTNMIITAFTFNVVIEWKHFA